MALIARFQDVKGHDVFQAMARRVAQAIPQARFIVAGENVHGSPADDAYKARILAAHQADPLLRERLVYLGFRPDAERVMAAADVVVCSSQFESYGMVNVEAMASGKPVVSTRRGGPSETVADGETGYLVDAGDADALAQHVIALLRDPDLRRRMGAAGRARVGRAFRQRRWRSRFDSALQKSHVGASVLCPYEQCYNDRQSKGLAAWKCKPASECRWTNSFASTTKRRSNWSTAKGFRWCRLLPNMVKSFSFLSEALVLYKQRHPSVVDLHGNAIRAVEDNRTGSKVRACQI